MEINSHLRERILKVQEETVDLALDPTQPLVRILYNLSQEFPNDMEFGNKVRILLRKIEDKAKETSMKESSAQLEKILQNGKNE